MNLSSEFNVNYVTHVNEYDTLLITIHKLVLYVKLIVYSLFKQNSADVIKLYLLLCSLHALSIYHISNR